MGARKTVVDFVVHGIDDWGRPSETLLEVVEAAVVDDSGRILGRFKNADGLARFLMTARGHWQLVALETVGLPRCDLTGVFRCSQQAWPSLVDRRER
jgi:hypothetical protein